MYEVKKIDVLSCGKISGVFGLLVGVIFTFLISMFSYFIGSMFGGDSRISFYMYVIFIISYGIFGFLGGIISALIYNGVAGLTGGIKVELG